MVLSMMPANVLAVEWPEAATRAQLPQRGSDALQLVDGYYEIYTADQLYWFAEQVNSGNTSIDGKLMADIAINKNLLKADGTFNSGKWRNWIPIGNSSNQYTGTFDGNSKTISGLYFNDTSVDYVGLFGCANGTIRNVCVVDSYLNGGNLVGGIVGYNYKTVSSCSNAGTVKGTNGVGGVVGISEAGTVENCTNSGSISGSIYVGGVLGENYGNATNCSNIGVITGTTYVGGVIGGNSGTVGACYNTGAITGDTYVGGVVGVNFSSVSNSYNTSKVIGRQYVGGVVGYDYFATVSNCYSTGTVSGTSFCVGGVVGKSHESTVSNCYYLSGCAKDGNGVVQFGLGFGTQGGTEEDVTGVATGVTTQQLASGEAAYLLGDAFGQKIGTDSYPVLGGEKVYMENGAYFNNLEGACKHNYQTVVTKPTCITDGYTTYTCTKCGDSYQGNTVMAPGHSWKDANCQSVKTCTVCGLTLGNPMGHHFGEVVVHRPTPNAQGYSEHRCVVCGFSEKFDYVSFKGVTVSGTVTGFLEGNVTVALLQGGNVIHSVTAGGEDFTIDGVQVGEYTLRVSKINHATREFAVTVDQQTGKLEIILLPVGDISGDGVVNTKDFARLLRYINKTDPLTDYELACGDVTGDGVCNIKDFQRLLRHVNKTSPLY